MIIDRTILITGVAVRASAQSNCSHSRKNRPADQQTERNHGQETAMIAQAGKFAWPKIAFRRIEARQERSIVTERAHGGYHHV